MRIFLASTAKRLISFYSLLATSHLRMLQVQKSKSDLIKIVNIKAHSILDDGNPHLMTQN